MDPAPVFRGWKEHGQSQSTFWCMHTESMHIVMACLNRASMPSVSWKLPTRRRQLLHPAATPGADREGWDTVIDRYGVADIKRETQTQSRVCRCLCPIPDISRRQPAWLPERTKGGRRIGDIDTGYVTPSTRATADWAVGG